MWKMWKKKEGIRTDRAKIVFMTLLIIEPVFNYFNTNTIFNTIHVDLLV